MTDATHVHRDQEVSARDDSKQQTASKINSSRRSHDFSQTNPCHISQNKIYDPKRPPFSLVAHCTLCRFFPAFLSITLSHPQLLSPFNAKPPRQEQEERGVIHQIGVAVAVPATVAVYVCNPRVLCCCFCCPISLPLCPSVAPFSPLLSLSPDKDMFWQASFQHC